MTENAERALAACRCDTIVASDPFSVTWLTGFAPEILYGQSPFAGPPLAVVRRDGSTVLVVSSDEEEAAHATGCKVVTYVGYTTDPLDPYGREQKALRGLGLSGRIGVEAHALTRSLAAALGDDLEDVAGELQSARAVKTPAELDRVRASIRLCDAGIAEARKALAAGVSELEAWSDVVGTMEALAGERLTVLADFASGPRTADVGGPPTGRRLEQGDLVIVDLSPRLNGYWGDSCATIAIGEPSLEVRELHARACEALERGLAAIRPGVVAGDLDRMLREGLGYPHHTGHGLGTSYHEEPRIVPGSPTVLEPNMVVALEPGGYPGPWGLRVERIAIVTDDGCEVLSTHDIDL